MYKKSFKVNGQDDIDDFMLMVDATYYKYSEITRKDFFVKNYNKTLKIKSLDDVKINVVHQSFKKIKNLYFTDLFTVDTKIIEIDYRCSSITIKNNFLNQKNELCATMICNLKWL